MIYFLEHFKGTAYFLVMLILFQSCVVYKKTPSTIGEATSEKDTPVKIITNDGKKYKLKWIEEKDGKIISTKNVKMEYINKKDILQIVISDSAPHVIPLDSVSQYYGKASFLLKDRRGNFESQEFIQFEDLGNSFRCYQMSSEDTLTVVIPLQKVENIKVVNKRATATINVLGILGLAFFVLWIHNMSQLETT